MTKEEVKRAILESGGNEYVAAVLTSEQFALLYGRNLESGLSETESLRDAFVSCQKHTLSMVQQPEIMRHICRETYTAIRSAHGIN